MIVGGRRPSRERGKDALSDKLEPSVASVAQTEAYVMHHQASVPPSPGGRCLEAPKQ